MHLVIIDLPIADVIKTLNYMLYTMFRPDCFTNHLNASLLICSQNDSERFVSGHSMHSEQITNFKHPPYLLSSQHFCSRECDQKLKCSIYLININILTLTQYPNQQKLVLGL